MKEMGKTFKRMTNWFVALSIYYYSLARLMLDDGCGRMQKPGLY
jgi:hypothetical protein